tara:strand:+ start:2267 stop:3253 length:987 start_codon:yes stop_codon:yes gene_type:complete
LKTKINYGEAILSAFEYLLDKYPQTFIVGQGLWSPWYVGNSMKNLDKKYGKERVIDTPVSESAVTGMAVGASLTGGLPIVVHPRIDFMLYAMDAIVNQAAKWHHMTGGQSNASLTVRGIINRGGEQGAQHSQSLHSWFAHIPGLRVVMPFSVSDARDLLISSVLCKDPVIFIDDRWLYESEEEISEVKEIDLRKVSPKILKEGEDLTIVGTSYSTKLALESKGFLAKHGINAEVIDTRVINPFNFKKIIESVNKTGRLVVIDGGWKNCGFSSEVISSVIQNMNHKNLKTNPLKFSIVNSPAPSSRVLEEIYYPKSTEISKEILEKFFS